ncbi:MAG: dehydrogenase related to lactate dehydrogenase [Pseudomonadota bacterium]|jgi:hydroxypyruvate reductase
MDNLSASALLRKSFEAAVAAADPLKIVAQHLPNPPARGRTLVVGAGKAAASMAAAVEVVWPHDQPLSGIVITRYAHGLPLTRIRCVEAGHPVPDDSGEQAAAELFEQVTRLTEDDQLIVLVSGGGSSLLALPVDGVSMSDLKSLTQALLKSGAPITEMNVVRKHLSKAQGGQLALASRAPVTALVISDVVGDDPSAIASGPCSADPSTYADAQAVLRRWSVVPAPSVEAHLAAGVRGEKPETPKPGDARLSHARTVVIATAHASLEAASRVFSQAGIRPIVLGDSVTGEARDVAQVYASWVRELALFSSSDFRLPVALISGGECTVTVRGSGRGGRCVEFLLALGLALDDLGVAHRAVAIAADTDGIDGVSPHAGAVLLSDTVTRARAQGLSMRALLDNNDGLGLFEPLGDVITTGATRTNVNDYRAIVVF